MGSRVGGLHPYVPRIALDWDLTPDDSNHRSVDGTLVFADISGFTTLSERLAERGRIGAEELTGVLNRVFGEMLRIVLDRGGSLLKFGGDALLLLFDSPDHLMQACAASVEMRGILRKVSREKTSVGRIDLRMSSGIHTGSVDLFLVGESHLELLVAGSVASITTQMEAVASAGEIVVSSEAKKLLPTDFTGDAKGTGWVIRKRKVDHPTTGPPIRHGEELDVVSFVPRRLREYLSSGVSESEHRVATIGFLEFKGTDRMIEEEEPALIEERLNSLVTEVQRAVDEEGVTFMASDIDHDGGKIIFAAGVPSRQHDDEGRMLRASRRILDNDPGLNLRIGLNRGHVFTGDIGTDFRRTFTVMGDSVNLAARLMTAAGAGSLYAPPAVLDQAGTLFRTRALQPITVKGKKEPVKAYEVFEETGVRPAELRHELPFHGREAELEMIVTIVTTCARVGHGGMLSITGDTGIGKSRLIAEVLDRCPGLATLMLKAEPNGSNTPYWAFRDPMRRKLGVERVDTPTMTRSLRRIIKNLDPELLPLLPLFGDVLHIDIPDNETTSAIDRRFRPDKTAQAMIELLSQIHPEPFALLTEDGQWLDDASRNLIRKVGEAASQKPWTVIVTMREVEHGGLELFGDEIRLSALADDTIRSIANEVTAATPLRPDELDSIVTRAGGNPLFLAEILSVVRETGTADNMPDSLDSVVSTQIDTLPPLARQTLRYTSVLGTSFPGPVVDEFLAVDDMELDQATRADLERFVEADGDTRLRFRHAVVHEVAYRSLPYRRRRELHERAGEVVERMSADDPNVSAEFLAYHYFQAGRHDKAWRYSLVAGERAKQAYANPEASAHYERALDAARRVDGTSRGEVADVWKELGIVRQFMGQLEAARDAFLQAIRLSEADIERVVDLRIRRADIWLNSRRIPQAKRELTLARRAIEGRRGQSVARLKARIESFEGGVQTAAGNPRAALAAATKAIALANRSGEEAALAQAYMVYDLSKSRLGEDPEHTQDAVAIYQRLGRLDRSSQAMSNLGIYAYFRGDWDEAVEWYERSVHDSDRAGDVVKAAVIRANIAEVLIHQRHCDRASPIVAEAERILRASNAHQWLLFVDLQRARLEIATDEPAEAVARLDPMFHDQIEGHRTDWTPEIALSFAEALVNVDNPDAALDVLDTLERTESDLLDEVRAGILRIRALAQAQRGNFDTAMALLEESLTKAVAAEALYEELLSREARVMASTQAGIHPNPIDLERVDALRDRLHVEAPRTAQ